MSNDFHFLWLEIRDRPDYIANTSPIFLWAERATTIIISQKITASNNYVVLECLVLILSEPR